MRNAWLTFFQPNPGAMLRLFCFPHAGAGASVYRSWASELPSTIEVCGIQYPGREVRGQEPPFRNLTRMLDALVPAVVPALDRPFAFFGHSMGALVSFELTRALGARIGPRPEHVFFSGLGAPHTPGPQPIHHLPDREFLRELVKLNGIPADVLRSVDLVRYVLPILRADFSMCETYRYQIGAPLQSPITAFGGELDPRVDRPWLDAWSDHSTIYFSSKIFPGDHFFLRTAQSAVLRALVDELQPLIDAAAAA
jgi:medium-chain acyl-[acyl-carrier-protein] hydrolase